METYGEGQWGRLPVIGLDISPDRREQGSKDEICRRFFCLSRRFVPVGKRHER